MADFKRLEIINYPRVGAKSTIDGLYWKKFEFPCAFKEFGAIDCIDVSSEESNYIAVTCSSRVKLYDPVENSVHCTLSRFKQTAYGGVFRNDGKLLVAGSEDGFLRLFGIESQKLLRIFKGHKAATHRCQFTNEGVHIVSFSDDKSVVLWDIPTETQLSTYSEHQDYIRAGAVSQISQNIFISGSYDHTVKMYDTRTPSSVMSVNHEAPVESVVIFPLGGIFISAGGTNMKVWDPIAGRLLAQVSQHHKTITSMCFAKNHSHLVSASLDRHVKIYDASSYEVVHTMDYPSSILSVAVSPGDKVIAAGMTDGLFTIKHRKIEAKDDEVQKKKKNIFYRYHWYGTDLKPAENDIRVPGRQVRSLQKYDQHLRKFNSSRALDEVLRLKIRTQNPEITISVIMELIRRGTIRAAMAGREGESLQKLVHFVARNISDARFIRVLTDIARILIEIYGPKLGDPETKKIFEVLLESLKNEDQAIKKMMEIHSVFETVLIAHSLSEM